MRVRTQALIDQLLGRPLVWILNGAAYLLGKFIRRDHRLETTRTIVICKLLGLGSIIQMTPLASSLKAAYPEARLLLLTRASNLPYCRMLPVIDSCVPLDDSSLPRLLVSGFSALRTLWRLRVDLFFNLEVFSNLGALLTITSCARNRIGYYLQSRDLRAYGIYTHIVYFNQLAPIADVYLHSGRAIGIPDDRRALIAPVGYADEAASLADKLLEVGLHIESQGYFVINPNASDLRLERRWPIPHWADLLRRIAKSYPAAPIIVIGGPGEEAVGRAVLASTGALSAPLVEIAGRLTLGELTALIANAKALISNDSGPMHIAFSLGTPCVALFGPVSPEHYGTSEKGRSALLYRRLYCSPCVHHFLDPPCQGDNQCMKLIAPNEVFAALQQLLAGASSSGVDVDHRFSIGEHVFGRQARSPNQ